MLPKKRTRGRLLQADNAGDPEGDHNDAAERFLSNELLLCIFAFLQCPDRLRPRQVCKDFKRLAEDAQFWRPLVLQSGTGSTDEGGGALSEVSEMGGDTE